MKFWKNLVVLNVKILPEALEWKLTECVTAKERQSKLFRKYNGRIFFSLNYLCCLFKEEAENMNDVSAAPDVSGARKDVKNQINHLIPRETKDPNVKRPWKHQGKELIYLFKRSKSLFQIHLLE